MSENTLQERPETLMVRFEDRESRRQPLVFYIGRPEEGDQWFKRQGDIVLAHAPSANDAFFALCVMALERAMSAMPAPPTADNVEAWQRAVGAAVERTALPLRFDLTVRPVGEDEDDDELDALLDELLAEE